MRYGQTHGYSRRQLSSSCTASYLPLPPVPSPRRATEATVRYTSVTVPVRFSAMSVAASLKVYTVQRYERRHNCLLIYSRHLKAVLLPAPYRYGTVPIPFKRHLYCNRNFADVRRISSVCRLRNSSVNNSFEVTVGLYILPQKICTDDPVEASAV